MIGVGAGARHESPRWAGAIWCCELELSGSVALRSVSPPAGHQTARILIRLHGEPMGYLTAPLAEDALDVDAVATLARRSFAADIGVHLTSEGIAVLAEGAPPSEPRDSCPNRVPSDDLVSVVICTRNRSAELAESLERLQTLTYPRHEVIVVDNAASDDRTQKVVTAVARRDSRVRWVREPRPGLSRARNRGLREARGRYLVYTDDDVTVDPDWLQGLIRGFRRRPDVGCVTGLVCTASIDTPAEHYFDARTESWSTRCRPQYFDLTGTGAPNALYPYSAGIFGTGANFGFDREFLLALGGFDEALGAGSRARGGEDLDIFVRVLRAGRSIVYEPSAIVWHHHRADEDALLKQMFGYGTGLTAFLTKCLIDPDTRYDVLRRVPLGVRRIVAINAKTGERLGGADKPRSVLAREFAGFAAGPVLYLQARCAIRGDRASYTSQGWNEAGQANALLDRVRQAQ